MYPMHHGQDVTIQITQIANGWMVLIPVVNQMMFPNQQQMSEKEIRRQARILKDEIQGDDLLRELQAKNEEPEEIELPAQPTIADLRIDNVFMFKTFAEVLEFLGEKIKTKK